MRSDKHFEVVKILSNRADKVSHDSGLALLIVLFISFVHLLFPKGLVTCTSEKTHCFTRRLS